MSIPLPMCSYRNHLRKDCMRHCRIKIGEGGIQGDVLKMKMKVDIGVRMDVEVGELFPLAGDGHVYSDVCE